MNNLTGIYHGGRSISRLFSAQAKTGVWYRVRLFEGSTNSFFASLLVHVVHLALSPQFDLRDRSIIS